MSFYGKRLSGNVFVTGDYHFNHGNIIRYCNRPFRDSREMDGYLIKNTNNLVKPKDTLICVGDFVFPGRDDPYQAAKKYREQISCENVYFVWGNHDRRPDQDQIMQAFYGLQKIKMPLDHGRRRVDDLSVEELREIVEELRQVQDFAWSIRNVGFQKLFKGCYDLFEFEVNGKQAVAGHYAYRVWNKSHHGRLHLYGHSHYSLPDDPDALSMDVGVDAAAHYLSKDGVTLNKEDYRPLAWNEVLSHMSKKNFKPIDHHGRE